MRIILFLPEMTRIPKQRFSRSVYIIHMIRLETHGRLESEDSGGEGADERDGAHGAVGNGTGDRLAGLGLLRLLGGLRGGLGDGGAGEGGLRRGGHGGVGRGGGRVGGGGGGAVARGLSGGLSRVGRDVARALDLEGERVLEDLLVGLELDLEAVGLVIAEGGGDGPLVLANGVDDTSCKSR